MLSRLTLHPELRDLFYLGVEDLPRPVSLLQSNPKNDILTPKSFRVGRLMNRLTSDIGTVE